MENQAEWTMKNGLVKTTAFNLLMILVGMASVELISGLLGLSASIRQLNVVTNRRVEYDLNGIYSSPTGISIYERDRFGLRGEYPSPDQIDILTVGGSATDQRFITEGETWQDKMAEIWRMRGKTISVVNAGVDGQTTYGHLKNFEWWFPQIPNLEPRFVLFYIGVNDLFIGTINPPDQIEDPSKLSHSYTHEERAQIKITSEIWSWLIDHSVICRSIQKLLGIIAAKRARIDHHRGFYRNNSDWTSERLLADPHGFVASDLEDYKDRISRLLLAARKLGAKPILVTQSANYFTKVGGKVRGFRPPAMMLKGRSVLGVDIYSLLRLYADAALEACREEKECLAVDLLEELNFAPNDFYDNVHNTPQGAERLARYLVSKVDGEIEPDAPEHN